MHATHAFEVHTQRLLIRNFNLADAPAVQRLAGDWRVAKTTLAIPHPYPNGAAETWIGTHADRLTKAQGVVAAVILRETAELIGCVGIERYASAPERAELGYWVGVPWWGQGFCTEAVSALLKDVCQFLPGVGTVVAHYLLENPASGRVMEKAGMSVCPTPVRSGFGGRCAGKPIGCYSVEIP